MIQLLWRFEFRWTGWKEGDKVAWPVGQWLAWNHRDRQYFYASYPGGEGRYAPGDIFDITPKAKQTTGCSSLIQYCATFVRLLRAVKQGQ